MANFSFDIESTYDKAEMINVYNQVLRELGNRYDLKDTSTALEWLDEKTGFKLMADQQFQLDALLDMIRKVSAKRGIDQNTFDVSQTVQETNLKLYWQVPFKNGLDSDQAKKITKIIRDQLPKIKTQIQGQTVRVVSSKKDELQRAMQIVKSAKLDFPISFTNLR